MGNIQVAGPNEALVVSGGCLSGTKRTIVGGWAWAWWYITDVQYLSLEVMTLKPLCEDVETAQGVPLTVTGVAQCKIVKENDFLTIAAEQFLGMTASHVKSLVQQTLEGHLRAILGTLTVEEIYRDRDQFATLVREIASTDVGRMGIEIMSFTIKDVFDNVEYLSSLGKRRTAEVRKDAAQGVAEAERDAGIREAQCEKESMDVKYGANTKIEDSNRNFQLQKAGFDSEVNTKKAESQLAYELEAVKMQQKIQREMLEIDVVERRKQIDVEESEIRRKELELKAQIRLPAESEAYRVEQIAAGQRTQTVQTAKAKAQRTKLIGGAEAFTIEVKGQAEADEMKMKAAAYKQYGEAAILALTLEALPKIAAEVAAPLAKTKEIVLLGGNDSTSDSLTRLVSQLPPALNALTGVDLSGVLAKIPGAKVSG